MIDSGSILIEKDAVHPRCFHLEDESSPHSWMTVKHNLSSHQLEEELARSGWTFFFMAGAIREISFGFDRAKMLHAALKCLIAGVRIHEYNCLQVDSVTMHSFLGIPYVSVSAHARHIQRGMVFSAA